MTEKAQKSVDNRIYQRLYVDYPWVYWALGWLALLKAFIWLSTDPVMADRHLLVLGSKYVLFLVPLVVCAIGIWKMKTWAVWGLGALAVVEILFFLLYPAALSSLTINRISLISFLLSGGAYLVNGPVSALLILVAVPFALKHKRPDR